MLETNHTKVLQGSMDLRRALPRNAVTRIAEKHGVSWTWAYAVITGKHPGDPAILIDAQKMADINREFESRLKNAI
jgi:hypothetical protein